MFTPQESPLLRPSHGNMSIGGMFLAHEMGTDPHYPSFFEVFMQDRIHQSLKPAVRHVFLVLAERWPQAVVLLDHLDEVFAIMSLFLERHYLAKNDALFSESLYGFKRSRYRSQEGTGPRNEQHRKADNSNTSNVTGQSEHMKMSALTQGDRRLALLVTILAPYAKAKLDALYIHYKDTLLPSPVVNRRSWWGGNGSSRGQGRRWRSGRGESGTAGGAAHSGVEGEEDEQKEEIRVRLRRVFVAMYPLLHAAYEGSFFVYQWTYLLGRRKQYSPLLHIAGQVLRRLSQEDVQPPAPSITEKKSLTARLVRSFKVLLLLGIVAFKLLEWWMSSPDFLQSPRQKRIVPPVPDPPAPAPTGVPLPKDAVLCPLCLRPRVNPAVTSAGVVFCYKCLLPEVRKAGVCPVTLQPCREEQVRRIYLT